MVGTSGTWRRFSRTARCLTAKPGALAGLFVAALVCVPQPSTGSAHQVAQDEAFVAKRYDNCAAFTPSPHHCSFAVVTTLYRAGERLYGIELLQQTGDDCYRGIVYFFADTRFIRTTRQLPPYSIGGVAKIRVSGRGLFSVAYLVDKTKYTSCAAGGNGGTDTYVYRWTGTRMIRESGQLPKPPEVILGTGQ